MGEKRDPVGVTISSRGNSAYSGSGPSDYSPMFTRSAPVGWQRFVPADSVATDAAKSAHKGELW